MLNEIARRNGEEERKSGPRLLNGGYDESSTFAVRNCSRTQCDCQAHSAIGGQRKMK